jgi:hypothetical protein
MATSKVTGLRYADLPTIAAARFPDNAAASQALEQIRQTLAIRFGKSASQQDRAVTWGDLYENGFAVMVGKDGKVLSVPNPSGTFQPSSPAAVDAIPPAPTGLTVSAGLATITLTWDQPGFDYFGYAEIYRNTEDNQATATRVGETSAWVYADSVNSSTTYYYWVRFISAGGKVGPFNAVAGTSGTTSLDPAYLIDVLSAAGDPNALLYTIPEDTTINGVAVPAGLYMRDIYVANGSISNEKVGNAAIDDAKIANLSAAKVTFGVMSGDRIDVNSLDADRIINSTLVTKLAAITDAYIKTANIDDAAVTAAKIASATITAAQIANAAITAAKIASGTITNAQIANGTIGTVQIADGAITNTKIGTAQITTAKIGVAQIDTLRLAAGAVTTYSGFAPSVSFTTKQIPQWQWGTLWSGNVGNAYAAYALATMYGQYYASGAADTFWIRVLINGTQVYLAKVLLPGVPLTASTDSTLVIGSWTPLGVTTAFGFNVPANASITLQQASDDDNTMNVQVDFNVNVFTAYR